VVAWETNTRGSHGTMHIQLYSWTEKKSDRVKGLVKKKEKSRDKSLSILTKKKYFKRKDRLTTAIGEGSKAIGIEGNSQAL